MNDPLTLREFVASDAEACWRLFHRTVREVNVRDYTADQIAAWAPDDLDRDAWTKRFEGHVAYVVELADTLVGFTDLAHDGYLDRLFVSADHQRQGIATMLLAAVVAEARRRDLASIHTAASITAKPFFLAQGFVVTAEQLVQRRGVTLRNFAMQRWLLPPSPL